MMKSRERVNGITEGVLGAVFEVQNNLGCGFLEKLYEHALNLELKARGLRVQRQACFKVLYKGVFVGHYYADLAVEGVVLVELKCVERFEKAHLAQCLNQLRASGLPVCLLVNFQAPKVEYKQVVLDF